MERAFAAVNATARSELIREALAFAVAAHAGQRRGDGRAPFIEHVLEVARLLRDSGCPETVVAAGLLHDVIETTDVRAHELENRFGARLSQLVQTVTDDGSQNDRGQRERDLCEKVRRGSADAALIFAADKISGVPQLRRDARAWGALDARTRARVADYRNSLRMLEGVASGHPLVKRLATELASLDTMIDSRVACPRRV